MSGVNFERIVAGRLPALAVGCLLLLWASPSFAYRTLGDDPALVGGDQVVLALPSTFEVTPITDTFEGVSTGDVEDALLKAVAVWREVECSGFRAGVLVGGEFAGVEHGDGRNSVVVVQRDWDSLGFEPEAVGGTDLELRQDDDGWRIEEADIYLNWAKIQQAPGGSPLDRLEGVLIHEMGHALGLKHPCGEDGLEDCPDGERPVMAPVYDLGQGELSTDDADGLCFLYPQEECAGDHCEDDSSPTCGGFDCEVDSANVGEPCVHDDECIESACDESGFCAVEPETEVQGIGAHCDSADDCEGEFCVEGIAAEPFCSRSCGATVEGCPLGWSCNEVDELPVCTPNPEDGPSQGCSLNHMGRNGPHYLNLILMTCFLALWGRRVRVKKNQ